MTYCTQNIGYLIYKLTYFNSRVSSRALYRNYMALAIDPFVVIFVSCPPHPQLSVSDCLRRGQPQRSRSSPTWAGASTMGPSHQAFDRIIQPKKDNSNRGQAIGNSQQQLYTYILSYIHIYIYICEQHLYVYLYMCIYIHIYIEYKVTYQFDCPCY